MNHVFSKVVMALAALALAAPAQAYEGWRGPTGVLKHVPDKSFNGYTVLAPLGSTRTYLIDNDANVVHTWESQYRNGSSAVLLPDGHLLRGSTLPRDEIVIPFGGYAGLLEEFDWEGNKVWELRVNSKKGVFHHGMQRLPNGNTLVTAWEYKTREEALAKGRTPETLERMSISDPDWPVEKPVEGFWPDAILEFDRQGNIVWEWHVWDHVGTGPDQWDINYLAPYHVEGPYGAGPDWTHFNALEYNPDTDQILLSSNKFSEIYLIDKKTGSMVWRFGNPAAYGQGRAPGGRGDDGDQVLFGQHNPAFLPNGHISVFDNGSYRPEGARSRIVEIDPKTNAIVWQFATAKVRTPNSFYTPFQGSAQLLPNGNYLVCSTLHGHLFEVTREKEVVWDFVNPISAKGPICAIEDDTTGIWVHRAYRYAKDHPALADRDLSPKGRLNPGCPDFRPLLEARPQF